MNSLSAQNKSLSKASQWNQRTNPTGLGNGTYQPLIWHTLNCPPGQILQGWKVQKPNENQVMIEYKCTADETIVQNDQYSDSIIQRFTGSNFADIANFNVRCKTGYALRNFRYIYEFMNRAGFTYICVKMQNLINCSTKRLPRKRANGSDMLKPFTRLLMLVERNYAITAFRFIDSKSLNPNPRYRYISRFRYIDMLQYEYTSCMIGPPTQTLSNNIASFKINSKDPK